MPGTNAIRTIQLEARKADAAIEPVYVLGGVEGVSQRRRATRGGVREDIAKFVTTVPKGAIIVADNRDSLRLLVREFAAALGSISRAHSLSVLLTRGRRPADDFLSVLHAMFGRVIGPHPQRLPTDEMLEVLAAPNRQDLFIAGTLDRSTDTLLLVRGDCSELVVPLSMFTPAANGITPNFEKFAIRDYGHAIGFGDYEASADAILYEADAEYRSRLKQHQREHDTSFGACLRRLRTQRGLRQADFSGITEKTIQRIENGEIEKPHARTLKAIAKTLRVKPDEILGY